MTNRSLRGGSLEGVRATLDSPEGSSVAALLHEQRTQSEILHSFLRHSTATLDALVWNKKTVECDAGAAIVAIDLIPQTSQTELVEGFLFNLHLPAGSSVTVNSAFVQFDTEYLGCAGMVASPFYPSYIPIRMLLGSQAVRHGEIDITGGNFPVGSFFSFGYFGRAIPSTLAETLH